MIRVVGEARDSLKTLVSEVMTSVLRSVGLATPVAETLRLMSDRHHRYLPVVDDGLLCGLISMGDVTRWVIQSQREQVDLAINAVKQMGYSNPSRLMRSGISIAREESRRKTGTGSAMTQRTCGAWRWIVTGAMRRSST